MISLIPKFCKTYGIQKLKMDLSCKGVIVFIMPTLQCVPKQLTISNIWSLKYYVFMQYLKLKSFHFHRISSFLINSSKKIFI